MDASTLSLISLLVASLSAGCAIFSVRASSRSAEAAEASLKMNTEHFKQSTELTKNIFKRQGVISLHEAWQGLRGIDPKNLVTPDVVRAVNTLGLTSVLWNHDIVDRTILFQEYWSSFRSLYDTLDRIDTIIPGLSSTGKNLLTPGVRRAYDEMHIMETDAVKISRIA